MIVLKFGGTSVGSAAALELVKSIVQKQSVTDQLVVVVSAVSGMTNLLQRAAKMAASGDEKYEDLILEIERTHLSLCKQLLPLAQQSGVLGKIKMQINELEDVLKGIFLIRELTPKSNDFVLSFGEKISSLLIYHFLANSIELTQINPLEIISCDRNYGNGTVDFKKSKECALALQPKLSNVNICAGFIASTDHGELITLGRGGSDYTAALFAGFYQADRLEIWTDVSGIMTADPRLVSNARAIPHLSYEEALELSHFGAKVIYPPSIQPAMESNIPILIKNTFSHESEGSTITRSWEDTQTIRGISSIREITLLNMSGSGMIGVPNFSYRLFHALSQAKINIVLITQASSEHTICVGIETSQAVQAVEVIHAAFETELKLHRLNPLEVENELAVVALVGSNMRNQVGVSGQLFHTLGKNGINIKAIAQGSSERNISTVVEQKDLKKALNSIHESFFTDEQKRINLFLIGTGNVGSTLITQIMKQQHYLQEQHHINLQVTAIANSRKMIFNDQGIKLDRWVSELHEGETYQLNDFLGKMIDFNLRNSVFLDVTGSDVVASCYAEVLKRSISIVTPNKIAATSPYVHYKTLKHLARKFKTHYLYETNVCAGLPVISTLSDLIKSGDRVHRIQAVLSGTLNYLFNHYDTLIPFAKILAQAKTEGYTEPDPRLDLSGEDVRRKILILIRETGVEMEMESISGESFVPEHCMKEEDYGQFLLALEKSEKHFQMMYEKAKNAGKRIRFIAEYNDGKATAGLSEVGSGHPFFHLEGKDNCVLFYTDRYKEQPLVVKGAGAGSDVTASGIFADIMKVANAY